MGMVQENRSFHLRITNPLKGQYYLTILAVCYLSIKVSVRVFLLRPVWRKLKLCVFTINSNIYIAIRRPICTSSISGVELIITLCLSDLYITDVTVKCNYISRNPIQQNTGYDYYTEQKRRFAFIHFSFFFEELPGCAMSITIEKIQTTNNVPHSSMCCFKACPKTTI